MKTRDRNEDHQRSEAETIRRRDEAVRRALNTPPKPLKDAVAERKVKREDKKK